jgi:hypothetical protein
MRRFQLERHEDASGVSGVGVVAEGVEFTDGNCAMRWLTATASTAFYASAEDVVTIHGHEGRTRLVWLDEVPRAGFGVEPLKRPQVEGRTANVTAGRARALGRRAEIIARLRRS